jgi:hypothetical protein
MLRARFTPAIGGVPRLRQAIAQSAPSDDESTAAYIAGSAIGYAAQHGDTALLAEIVADGVLAAIRFPKYVEKSREWAAEQEADRDEAKE